MSDRSAFGARGASWLTVQRASSNAFTQSSQPPARCASNAARSDASSEPIAYASISSRNWSLVLTILLAGFPSNETIRCESNFLRCPTAPSTTQQSRNGSGLQNTQARWPSSAPRVASLSVCGRALLGAFHPAPVRIPAPRTQFAGILPFALRADVAVRPSVATGPVRGFVQG